MAAFWVLTWPWLCAHFEKQGDRERENSGVSSSYKDTVPLQLGSYLYNSWNTYFHQEVKLLSHVWLFVIPWTVAYQAPLPVEFSWQECWSELPFPSVVDLPDLGIELISVQFSSFTQSYLTLCDSMDWNHVSCIAGRHFTLWATREALFSLGN